MIKYSKFQILMSLCNSKVYLPLSNIIKSNILKLFKKYQEIIQGKLQISKFNDNQPINN